MTDIPDDIRKAAIKCRREFLNGKHSSEIVAIARAIMAEREAERERCAKVATGWREADYPEWFDRRSAEHLAEHITAAIKKGE